MTTLSDVEVWLDPRLFEEIKLEESPNTGVLRSDSFGVLILAAERPFDVDAVLGANVDSRPDELFLPAALLSAAWQGGRI